MQSKRNCWKSVNTPSDVAWSKSLSAGLKLKPTIRVFWFWRVSKPKKKTPLQHQGDYIEAEKKLQTAEIPKTLKLKKLPLPVAVGKF